MAFTFLYSCTYFRNKCMLSCNTHNRNMPKPHSSTGTIHYYHKFLQTLILDVIFHLAWSGSSLSDKANQSRMSKKNHLCCRTWDAHNIALFIKTKRETTVQKCAQVTDDICNCNAYYTESAYRILYLNTGVKLVRNTQEQKQISAQEFCSIIHQA